MTLLASFFLPSGIVATTAHAGTEVMKNGEAVNMFIQKPQYELNPEHKPKVIVKRAAGKYETGTLVYIGLLKEKQMAGVELDIPSQCTDESCDWKFDSLGYTIYSENLSHISA